MIERRKYPRLDFSVSVEYKKLDGEKAVSAKADTKNIGAGGVCIVALDRFEIGDSLSLKFSLPDNAEPIKAKGTVAWVEEFAVGSIDSSKAYDAGIEFVEIEDLDKEKINKFVLHGIR